MLRTVVDKEFPSKLAESQLSDDARAEIIKVQRAGIKLDQYGQILPDFTRANESKIAENLLDVRHQVMGALGRGRHVIYVPGSYDLVHAGHASYIMQAIDLYLNDNRQLKRENLFVVALSDDDDLIQAIKPPHLTGQTKEHPRPIECDALFEHCSKKHPRLWDLASLPVDLVGFIPAPSRFSSLLGNQEFAHWFQAAQAIKMDGVEDQTLESYNRLISAMQSGDFVSIKADFQRVRFGLDFNGKKSLWDVGSWQALMHKFIGDIYQERSSERYVRIISEHDLKYKDAVAQLMKTCGISHKFINDLMVISTTSQVQQFGWEALVVSKINHFTNHMTTSP